jgi:putative FmdB family regulatory protein
MPLYEYRCRDCGHQFEILQRIGEGAAAMSCPRCDAGALEKQFSTFATASGGSASFEAAEGCGAGSCCGGGACGSGSWN